MNILNVAGYKFLPLTDLVSLKSELHTACFSRNLKGTILLSSEGINLSLSGSIQDVESFKNYLKQDSRFAEISFNQSFSKEQPFRFLRIKLKKEIIAIHKDLNMQKRAPAIAPEIFKQWMDERRDITILDTRNDYEVRFGTFEKALNLGMKHFSEFPNLSSNVDATKPIVMFCTGGIRCEKAALHLIEQGYQDVYQLEGGILNYFAKVGGEHWNGECFIFDNRIAVDASLSPTDTLQCQTCEGPIRVHEKTAKKQCQNCVSRNL